MNYIRPKYVVITPPSKIKTIKGFENWAKQQLAKCKTSITHDIRSTYK